MQHWFMNLSISVKQIMTLMVAGMLPMIVVGVLALNIANKELEQKAFDQLDSIRGIKASAVKRYFERIEGQMLSMTLNPSIKSAMTTFSSDFNKVNAERRFTESERQQMKRSLSAYYQQQFNVEYKSQNEGNDAGVNSLVSALDDDSVAMQYAYISNNQHALGNKHLLDSASGKAKYHATHEEYHPYIRNFLERFGFYDIFLVDIDSGTIVYSVFKELDYATSLTTGPYAQTNFGEAFRQARILPEGQAVLVDYEPYKPSYEAPASFIASPIYKQGKKVGVLIFQMPLEPINVIMTERIGLGETGETYLVGENKLMRSDSYLDPVNRSVVASSRNPEKGSVDTEAVNSALNGESGTKIIVDYNGNPVLSAFSELTFSGIKWVILAEIDEAEAFAGVIQLRTQMIIIGLIAAALISAFAYFVSRLISRPIVSLAETIAAVESKGDFSLFANNDNDDEVGKTCQSFNSLLSNLDNTFSQTNLVLKALSAGDFEKKIEGEFVGVLAETTDGVNSTVEQLKLSSEEQAEQRKLAEESAEKANSVAQMAEAEAAKALRIKQALDVANNNTMIADNNHDIIYMNGALSKMMTEAESDIRKDLPNFEAAKLMGASMDAFHKKPGVQRDRVEGLNSEFQTLTKVGGRSFLLVLNPIINAEGKRLGTCIEWTDRTQEIAIEKEVDLVVAAAAAGDFSQRVDLEGKSGFFKSLSEGLNSLVDTADAGLQDILRVLGALAKGDLTQGIDSEYEGAFGQMKNDANATNAQLTDSVGKIIDASNAISSAANEIAQGNADLSQRTEEQASSLEETASSMEEMTSTVKQSAEHAGHANDLAIEARTKATQGGEVVAKAVSAMSEINASSKKIADIIGVIDEIAFQTNLLALNAAVEAARAGEQGRGFAVVAGEVRSLAQRSADAAKEIKDLIRDSVTKVEDGSALVNESGETLNGIVEAVEKVSNIIEEISTSAVEQTSGIEQVNSAVSQMDEMTQQNAALVEEASASGEAMASQAKGLINLMNYFTIDEGSVGVRSASPASQNTTASKATAVQPANSGSKNDEWEDF